MTGFCNMVYMFDDEVRDIQVSIWEGNIEPSDLITRSSVARHARETMIYKQCRMLMDWPVRFAVLSDRSERTYRFEESLLTTVDSRR